MQKNKNITYYLLIILALLCILVGGAIYLVFRTRTLIMFKFIPMEYIITLNKIRDFLAFSNNNCSSFLIYNLPTGLWTISYLIVMQLICKGMPPYQRLIWVYLLPSLLLSIEFLQIFSFCHGTFDNIDVLTYIIPIIVSLLIDKRNEKL